MNIEKGAYPFSVLVHDRMDGPHWVWCFNNLTMGTFSAEFPIVGNRCTYLFKYEQDALAFKLKFGL